MACYHPLTAYRSRDIGPSGKRGIVFNASKGFGDLKVTLPCGQCIGCRLERSRQWAVRCVHEASLHPDNSFITLSYSDEHLPPGGTLVLRDFQLFMKRVRKHYGSGIRFFHCGEYGETTQRPHYHALLFGLNFSDKYVFKKASRSEHLLYRSPTLEKLWPLGASVIGSVTFESAAYCARYIVGKQTGPAAEVYEAHTDEQTGEIFGDRFPPYITMSRRPGVGHGWVQQFKSDVYPHDYVVDINGHKSRPPRYYDNQLDEKTLQRLKGARQATARKHEDNNTVDRLAVREEIAEAKLKPFKREDF